MKNATKWMKKAYKLGDNWVVPMEEGKLRIAMCEVYPDSAPKDWILRLNHWHIPAAISPLHDKDTYDSDKLIPLWRVDEVGELLLDQDGNPIQATDEEGNPIMVVKHLKGDIKKPHYHVMMCYGNSTTRESFMRIIRDIGGVVPPWEHMEVLHPMSMYRYFAHMDDPDKFQYDINDCILLGGFDPINYQTYADKNEPFNDILKDLKKHPEITSYKSLCYYYRGRDNRLFYFVMNHTMALNKLFKE